MADNFQWSDLASDKENKSKRNLYSIAAVAGIILLAILIPVIVSFSKRTQQTREFAAVFSGTKDTCGLIKVSAQESPICPRLTQSSNGNNTCTVPDPTKTNPNISNYTYIVSISSNDGKQHAVKYHYLTAFCKGGYGNFGVNGSKDCHCADNQQSSGNQSVTINTTGSKTIQMHRVPTTGFANCGAYQFDLSVDSIDGNTSCILATNQLGNNLSVGHCDTGIDCKASTPTPTPTPQPSVSPTPPVCQVNQSVCKWQAIANAVSYHYEVTDTTSGTTTQGDVNAPQTSVSFPSINGHSYSCTVTASNACGTGSSGTGTFTCAPTPTSCPIPNTPQNVRITCPNCASSQ